MGSNDIVDGNDVRVGLRFRTSAFRHVHPPTRPIHQPFIVGDFWNRDGMIRTIDDEGSGDDDDDEDGGDGDSDGVVVEARHRQQR